MSVKFSIIVPVHNSSGFMRKCLDSIIDQTYQNFEMIVVADRCQDDSGQVARGYTWRVFETDFGNDGPPRQVGVDMAHGEWVLFLDDDDYWISDEALQKINDALTDDIDILCFGFDAPEFRDETGKVPIVRHYNGADVFWPSVWNKCYRREFIRGTRFRNIEPDPAGNAPDIDWTSRLLARNPRIAILNEWLYKYNYMRPGSQTATKVKK